MSKTKSSVIIGVYGSNKLSPENANIAMDEVQQFMEGREICDCCYLFMIIANHFTSLNRNKMIAS